MSNTKLRSKKRAEATANTFIYIILIFISIVWLIPFVYLIFQAFRGESTGMVNYVFPRQWSFVNFIELFTKTEFLRWFTNTLLVALVVAVFQTVIVLMVSYTLSRMRFRGRRFLMNLILVLGMFPGFMSMIAVYFVLKLVGLTQNIVGLMLIYVGSSGMGYYIAKGYFDTIPRALDEAARIDGANRRTVFYQIILPMAKPIVIYTTLMAFMAPWGDYMFASLIAFGNTKSYNVAVGLYTFLDKEHIVNYFTRFCAGGVVIAIPITILFMLLQKYYVAGVTGGAVKG
ncbi:MAG TPA: ABC transporter permease subunit [Oscillospiraceae bacterium]|nr:ABC transporter permease subunit [Oscillospiraceae bacterium]HPF55546.1 ABC transporter permease subunit [Clostridiales bacterium]HPK35310.1 ABC transporter permease subunit [Oscillospiraceae bacterium]HPR76246.1 ABC transporter permease subunit [Oscillospiraceae bacterium]